MKKIILLFTTIFISFNLFSQTSININKENGVYIVPCKVNGIPMRFIFDTGATNVTLSQTEANFLIKQGLLKKEDIKETVKYRNADGKINEGTQIIIREIEVSGLIINNIKATIVHKQNAPLLLGMSALSQLGKIEIKNDKLIITNTTFNISNNNNFTEENADETIAWINNEFVKYRFSTFDSNNTSIKHRASIKEIIKIKGINYLHCLASQETAYADKSFKAIYLIPIKEIESIDFIDRNTNYALEIKTKGNKKNIITQFNYEDGYTSKSTRNEVGFVIDISIDKENLKPKFKRAFKHLIALYSNESIKNNTSKKAQKKNKITIKHKNGIEVFNIYLGKAQPNFKKNKEYFWYTEFSKIKSSKGGCGGKLLNGSYKYYDKDGNLILSKNYELGLLEGIQKKWDNEGKILEIVRYKKGEVVSWRKYENDGSSVEHYGTIMTKGWVKKSYDTFGNLYAEQTQIGNGIGGIKHIELFYKNGNLKEEFTTNGIIGVYVGEYKFYYKNGNVEIEAHFYNKDKYSPMRDGIWKWYKENGKLKSTETYKVVVEKWKNGKIKKIGSYIYDDIYMKWLKTGIWEEYTKDGFYIQEKEKEYKLGKEIKK